MGEAQAGSEDHTYLPRSGARRSASWNLMSSSAKEAEPATSLCAVSCFEDSSTKASGVSADRCASVSVSCSLIPQVVTKNLFDTTCHQGAGVESADHIPGPVDHTQVGWGWGGFEKVITVVLRAGSLIPKLENGPWKFQRTSRLPGRAASPPQACHSF